MTGRPGSTQAGSEPHAASPLSGRVLYDFLSYSPLNFLTSAMRHCFHLPEHPVHVVLPPLSPGLPSSPPSLPHTLFSSPLLFQSPVAIQIHSVSFT